MKKEIQKRPMAPVLQKMEIGDIEEFSRTQYRSLNSTCCVLQIETGRKFKKSYADGIIRVERIA